jgi:hypothetical protein
LIECLESDAASSGMTGIELNIRGLAFRLDTDADVASIDGRCEMSNPLERSASLPCCATVGAGSVPRRPRTRASLSYNVSASLGSSNGDSGGGSSRPKAVSEEQLSTMPPGETSGEGCEGMLEIIEF